MSQTATHKITLDGPGKNHHGMVQEVFGRADLNLCLTGYLNDGYAVTVRKLEKLPRKSK